MRALLGLFVLLLLKFAEASLGRRVKLPISQSPSFNLKNFTSKDHPVGEAIEKKQNDTKGPPFRSPQVTQNYALFVLHNHTVFTKVSPEYLAESIAEVKDPNEAIQLLCGIIPLIPRLITPVRAFFDQILKKIDRESAVRNYTVTSFYLGLVKDAVVSPALLQFFADFYSINPEVRVPQELEEADADELNGLIVKARLNHNLAIHLMSLARGLCHYYNDENIHGWQSDFRIQEKLFLLISSLDLHHQVDVLLVHLLGVQFWCRMARLILLASVDPKRSLCLASAINCMAALSRINGLYVDSVLARVSKGSKKDALDNIRSLYYQLDRFKEFQEKFQKLPQIVHGFIVMKIKPLNDWPDKKFTLKPL